VESIFVKFREKEGWEERRSRRSFLFRRVTVTSVRATVVGGGAAGVEIAANLGRLGRESGRIARITLVSRSIVLEDYPPKARALALASLARWGIEASGTSNCSGAGTASHSREPRWPGSESTPSDRTASSIGICSRFLREGLCAGSIPGVPISRY